MKKTEIQQLGNTFLKHNPNYIVFMTMLNYHQLLTKDGKKLFDYLISQEKEIVKENNKIISIHKKETIDKEELINLRYHRDITVGLWATDRPDLIPKDIKNLFFKIEYGK